jgi:hypothetical protein
MKQIWRCLALEYLALWEGALSAQRLGELVGFSREHAQRTLIGPYRQEMPGRLVSDGRRASRIEPDGTSTRRMPSDPGGFVAVLTGLKAIAGAWPVRGAFESVPLICRANGDNEAFVALYRAMCQRHSIYLEYQAKRGPRSYRFSPHTLVDTSSRPHFRGYAADPVSGTGRFIDLLPSRVSQLPNAEKIRTGPIEASGSYVSYESDNEWIRRVDLTFQLHENMDENLKEAISWEYAIQNGPLIFYDARAALAPYIIKHLLERRLEGRDHPIFKYVGSTPPLSSSDKEPEVIHSS